MQITHEFIEELKFRNKIEDVVSTYVTLKRSGSNYSGLCPFHSEKTPSFSVSPSRSTFHCFGCGVGGDVITFVMQADNLDYLSAVETLAKRAGMEMPQDENERSEGKKRARFYQMNKEAALFFCEQLKSESAVNARAYLEKRQMPDSGIIHFGIGFAPDSFGSLSDYMHKKGYTDQELKEGFLCGQSKSGKYYDYFRNRIMFPIIDVTGNVIAFGGRAIGDVQPKYLNTSDTPAFKKSRNLFALNFARKTDKDYLILCEGYMDVIAMHLAGFTNAVASLGTALTQEQARILSRYTKKIVLCYDSDEAGITATKRALPILEEAGLEARVLTVKDAKDPDEYIKKFGYQRFTQLVEGSQSKLDFLCTTIKRKYDMSKDDDKMKAGEEIANNIAMLDKDLQRTIYIDRIATEFGFDKAALAADVKTAKYRLGQRTRIEQTRAIEAATMGYGDTINREKAQNIKGANAEEALLGIMLNDSEITKKVRIGQIDLKAENFVTEFNRRVFSEIISEDGFSDLGMLAQKFDPKEISRIESMMNNRAQLTDNSLQVFKELIDVLKASAPMTGDDLSAIMDILNKKK